MFPLSLVCYKGSMETIVTCFVAGQCGFQDLMFPLSLVCYKGSMETIVTCFVAGQKINASTIPPTSDF